MKITVHQPDFLPWLGFFERWHKSDLYVMLDDVQFLRQGWHHRDKIKTQGGILWLTVPVIRKGRYSQRISEVETAPGPWRRKHLATIRAAYARAPFFDRVFPLLEQVYARNHTRLLDLNSDLLELTAGLLGITAPRVSASVNNLAEKGTARLVRLCELYGADVYLTGTGARDYLDETLFAASGIKVEWQDFVHPEYPQIHGPFTPGLSVLDFLMMNSSAFRPF